MYINVKLLNGFKDKLTYKVPEDWSTDNLLGSIVQVPLQKRLENAFVEKVFETLDPSVKFKIREAKSKDQFPEDGNFNNYVQATSSYYNLEKFYFFARLKHFLKEKEIKEEIVSPNSQNEIRKEVILNDDQAAIVNELNKQIEKQNYYPALIHGVTGSGKTEIYKQLITKNFSLGKSTILMLPEVSLAIQFYNILTKTLPSNIEIFSFHSNTSITEKKILWQKLKNIKPLVIIGVHLPNFLPISNLGLIIIDEEHDAGFQDKKFPRINAKEAALIRAKSYNIPIVLGSATPSISSLHSVTTKNWHLFKLTKRYAGKFPEISLVKLTENTNRPSFWISTELEAEIKNRLAKKEQTIIFINRRGFCFFIQCSKCGFRPTCNNCAVSLTLHNNKTLKCHYCNYSITEPQNCTNCQADSKCLLKKGIGTQQIVNILQKLFPSARIERADLDATVNKKKWQQTIKEFENQNLDILVGTQTITKGYHFPNVTLIGVLWADINLSMPIYNAAEITLQQIIQVAGRAGRQSENSKVIIQTMINHSIYNYLNEHDYLKFYDLEINNRSATKYPPIIRLAEIEMRNENQQLLEKESEILYKLLKEIDLTNHFKLTILGPIDPVITMIKKTYIKKIYLKANNINEIILAFKAISTKDFNSTVTLTQNPLN